MYTSGKKKNKLFCENTVQRKRREPEHRILKSGIQALMESGIHGCGIRNPQTWNPESTPWNPKSKTLLDYLTWGERFVNWAWFNTIFYFGKRLRKEGPWKPMRDETQRPLAQNNNKPVEVLHLKRESHEKSGHLQVLQILHILCFTDENCETETHFFLVKFLKNTSEYMNQKRHVFEFLIQGALRELISHDSLSNLLQSQWK